jgi:hypothetical protein
LSVEVVLLIDPSGPAGRPKKIIMCYSSSVHHVFLLFTVPACQGRPHFATTPNNNICY